MALTVNASQAGYQYLEGDVEWDNKTTIVYPAICTVKASLCVHHRESYDAHRIRMAVTCEMLSHAPTPLMDAPGMPLKQACVVAHMCDQPTTAPYGPDVASLGCVDVAVVQGAGLCAGMFGIGGGIVKGPLMLEMGVLPSVSSATAAFMILFTTASAASTYVVFGMLK